MKKFLNIFILVSFCFLLTSCVTTDDYYGPGYYNRPYAPPPRPYYPVPPPRPYYPAPPPRPPRPEPMPGPPVRPVVPPRL